MDRALGVDEFTEEHWPIVTKKTTAYAESKIKAEQAAWEFHKNNDEPFELCVVNPGFILGPTIGGAAGTSEKLASSIMMGKNKFLPKIWMPCVDVRDVAEAHFLALEKGVSGDRHILSAITINFVELGQTFHKIYGH